LDNEVLDTVDARCNHEIFISDLFDTAIYFGCSLQSSSGTTLAHKKRKRVGTFVGIYFICCRPN